MSNDLIGELSKKRLFDIVTPLLNGKRSGMVLIRGVDVGELHIEAGSIIHAQSGYLSGQDAVFAMMEWDAGHVTFDWEMTTEERTVSIPTEELIQTWIRREDEWEKIRQLIPSSNVVFRMAAESGPEDRNVLRDQWKVLALCNGIRTVSEIAHVLKRDLFNTSKTMYEMVETGLLEKVSEKAPFQKPPRKNVNGNFFPRLENELRKIMGPIAPIIIDDKISEFGESRESFPENRLESLVQSIGEEITDNMKRAVFAKAMRELSQKQN